MKKISILGGCGTVGRVATKILFSTQNYEITVCDRDKEVFESIFGEISKFLKFKELDANIDESIKDAIRDTDVVLNCIGPYYKYGPKILKEAIELYKNYVDVCDDFDATIEDLKFHQLAEEKKVSCLIGMGSSPGLANIIVKFAEMFLFDEINSIDIYHAHGGEEYEGPAVVKHRIHSMLSPIPVFLDGEYREVKLFEESGKTLEEIVEFPGLGTYPVYAYPHPETITLPKYIKGVKRVTNLGLVLPPQYAELIKNIVRVGIVEEEPIDVMGTLISPLDFSVNYILYKRKELIEKYGPKEPQGCLKITIKGIKSEENIQYDFSIFSKGKGMGEGTGIPAAIGTILMSEGLVKGIGVNPPEAVLNPVDVFKLLFKIMKGEKIPILIEKIKDKKKETVDLDVLLKEYLN
ncbi:MAG: saccharopine dehydrogenase NADP-binding domain-containing protein [Caldisericia bacterium]|jgi:saccharopine dehydrogenase (NAD+, L-lysine-forming)|nr:saccharopine dehydrogenase NADP-binding domain-containing protein [Caldisericia bacterium]